MTSDGVSNPHETSGLFPPSSYHTGGVNAVFFDGSVRFVPDTVDTGPASAEFPATDPHSIHGQSVYGVWGALGSPDGGESLSL